MCGVTGKVRAVNNLVVWEIFYEWLASMADRADSPPPVYDWLSGRHRQV